MIVGHTRCACTRGHVIFFLTLLQINLIVGDMLKVSGFFTAVIEDALDVVKWFNNHSRALGLLRVCMQQRLAKILALVLPVITRWTSHYLSVRRLLEVERPLREVALDPALIQCAGNKRDAIEKAESIVRTLSRQDFWDNLKRYAWQAISSLCPHAHAGRKRTWSRWQWLRT